MKLSEAAEIVLTLIKAFPHVRCDGQTADIYERSIADLEAGACRAAVQRLIATSKFFPAIAEIRAACAAQTHGVARTGEEAYAELTQAVRTHGRDFGQGTPKFRDPLISHCLGVWGSWNDVCSSPVDDAGGRARFIELYGELAGRARQDLASGKPLPKPANGTSPAFWLDRPKPRPRTEPASRPPLQLVTAFVARKPAANAEQAQSVPRRWSADELEAALAGGAS